MLLAIALASQLLGHDNPEIALLRQYYRYPEPQVIDSTGEFVSTPPKQPPVATPLKIHTVFFNRENFKEVTTAWSAKSKRFELVHVFWASHGVARSYVPEPGDIGTSPSVLNRLLLQDKSDLAHAISSPFLQVTLASNGRLLSETEHTFAMDAGGGKRILRHRFIRRAELAETRYTVPPGAVAQTLGSVSERQRLKRLYETPGPVSFTTNVTLKSREFSGPEKVETAVYRTVFVDRQNYSVALVEHSHITDLPRRLGYMVNGEGSPLDKAPDERWPLIDQPISILHSALVDDSAWLTLIPLATDSFTQGGFGRMLNQAKLEYDSMGRIWKEVKSDSDFSGHVPRWAYFRMATHTYDPAPPTLADLQPR